MHPNGIIPRNLFKLQVNFIQLDGSGVIDKQLLILLILDFSLLKSVSLYVLNFNKQI